VLGRLPRAHKNAGRSFCISGTFWAIGFIAGHFDYSDGVWLGGLSAENTHPLNAFTWVKSHAKTCLTW